MSLISKLFVRNKPLSLNGYTDWHCHLLPGVDDGVETLGESLHILRQYEAAGIEHVWLTPHIMADLPNATAMLRDRHAELCKAYDGKLEINLAAEYMIDNVLMDRLEADDVLPIGPKGDMLLVETSYFSAPMHLEDTFELIKSKGCYPLLAHPERYNYIQSIDRYRKMHEAGVRFQINLMSLCGFYGPMVRDKALRLLSEGMYHCFGTDVHRGEHFDIVTRMKVPLSVVKAFSSTL